MNTLQQVRFVWKPLVFALCLVPFALAAAAAFGIHGSLGANPIEALLDRFGNWGLRFLLIVLAVTPLRRLTGWNWLSRFRRPLGLFAFFYVLMHFLVWFVLDQGMTMSAILVDIVKRPFITLGFVALLILTTLAITSPANVRRRLGARWQTVHMGVYAAALLGVWHYWWQVKKDVTEPLIYAAILAVLLGLRIARHLGRRRAAA